MPSELQNARRTDDAQNLSQVRRFDVAEMGELRPAAESEEGFLILDVFIAKPGVLTYVDRHGERWRELIEASELHKQDSLKTLVGKPVTLEHPDDDVTPDSDPTISKGAISPNMKVIEDGRVRIEYMVQKRDAIDAVKSGEAREASPGYRCDIENRSGVHPEFGPYDRVQKNRRYNHGAICRQARGGPEIHLRYDSDARMVGASKHDSEDDDMDPKLTAALLAFFVNQGMSRNDAEDETKKMASKDAEIEKLKKDMEVMEEEHKKDMEVKKKKDQEGEHEDGEHEENPFAKNEDMEKPMSKKDALSFAASYFEERTQLTETAARFDSVDPKQFPRNSDLRKAIVLAANPQAKPNAGSSYYAAAYDMLPATGQRADAGPTRPTFGLPGQGFEVVRRDGGEQGEGDQRLDAKGMPNPEADAMQNMIKMGKG